MYEDRTQNYDPEIQKEYLIHDGFLSDVLSVSSPSLLALLNLSTLSCPLTSTLLFPHY